MLLQAQGSQAWKIQGSGCEGLREAQAKGHFLFLASYCPCQPQYKVRGKSRRGGNEIESPDVIGAGLTKEKTVRIANFNPYLCLLYTAAVCGQINRQVSPEKISTAF